MSNVILTAEDAYKDFLRGIRKYSTTTVTPTFFNPFFNDVIIEWVKSKLPLEEFNQKRIDDVEVLRVATDATAASIPYTTFAPPIAGSSNVFLLPKIYDSINSGLMYSTNSYPLYMHGLNAMFRVGVSGEWMHADIMRSDKRSRTSDNPFRVASSTRMYYEVIGNNVRLIPTTTSSSDTDAIPALPPATVATYMRLEYIRYPKVYNFSLTESECINPEFLPSQNKEIVDLAVRKYLEIIQDERYKSSLQESMLRTPNN